MKIHKTIRVWCLLVLVGSFTLGGIARSDERFTVHEWGTFTVLQNSDGHALPGVNVNEERLPPFVHRMIGGLVKQADSFSTLNGLRSKGLPISFPDAIMRMETPIIYIYPPRPGVKQQIDVRVQFRGGWISEWYPNAQVAAPGFKVERNSIGKLTPQTVGSIDWKNITVGTDKPLPETDEHVWLAPRQVAAPRLTTEEGATENYLFYRGVAHIEAPLRVVRDDKLGRLSVWTNPTAEVSNSELTFDAIWLSDIRSDGSVAFCQLTPQPGSGHAPVSLITTPAAFAPDDYANENLVALRASMKEAIMAAGLWEDEAEAMLETWELSYFKSPGLRLFFTLPRAWTDQVLPLEVSRPAEIERVMIGRIELISPGQRELLEQIAAGPTSNAAWYFDHFETISPDERLRVEAAINNGAKSLKDLGFRVPADYQAYVDLGRFREALVLSEAHHSASPHLEQFVRNYRLPFLDKPLTVRAATRPPLE